VYKTISVSGPDHKRVYERAVIIGERVVATGSGKNQKLADAAAAEAALEVLKGEAVKPIELNFEVITALKAFASKNKQPSPEFRDLGETPKSNANCREYIIECRCMGKSESAVGKSKQEARVLAAEKVYNLLVSPVVEKKQKPAVKINKQTKKAKPTVQKNRMQSNSKKSEKSASPKKQPHQHKKHL
jgi:dsRNA-specific ribonuclease